MPVVDKMLLVVRAAAILLPLVASGLFFASAAIAPLGGTGSSDAFLISAILLAVALSAGGHLWRPTRNSSIAGLIIGSVALVIVSVIFDQANRLGGSGYWQVAATTIALVVVAGYDYLSQNRTMRTGASD